LEVELQAEVRGPLYKDDDKVKYFCTTGEHRVARLLNSGVDVGDPKLYTQWKAYVQSLSPELRAPILAEAAASVLSVASKVHTSIVNASSKDFDSKKKKGKKNADDEALSTIGQYRWLAPLISQAVGESCLTEAQAKARHSEEHTKATASAEATLSMAKALLDKRNINRDTTTAREEAALAVKEAKQGKSQSGATIFFFSSHFFDAAHQAQPLKLISIFLLLCFPSQSWLELIISSSRTIT
jgi:hypothetical protein